MLDPTDKYILTAIEANARLSYTELAAQCSSTPTRCRQRLQHLEQAGYILDYTTQLDPVKLGMPQLMFIEITLDRTHPQAFRRLPMALRALPEVLECHRVTGRFDFLIKLRVRDLRECTALLCDMMSACPGIQRTHTRVVIEEVLCMSSALTQATAPQPSSSPAAPLAQVASIP
ncbi:Lrp/AsnC family transcriptional regulator [Noviherbaspirillum aerium]|uniref:Lrp/AsnC family transcriptional regulator n=1 Tax=Noviherbaspirillum aerium TaxID=2588497 RepID=UPI00124C48BF|nr:Lrp/AsnC family transcriptional regulator [Noviherbaspirillum aerium]